MPWKDGKKVTQAEWIDQFPPRPLIRYDVDGNPRAIGNQAAISAWYEAHGEAATYQDRDAATAARAKAVLAMVLGEADIEPYTPVSPQDGRVATTYPAPAPEERPESPVERPRGPEALEPAEKAATRHSDAIGMPRHNKHRPSQTSDGRRQRYLRKMADLEGTSLAEAERNHPPRRKS